MHTGVFLYLPEQGSMMDQDDTLMAHIRIAWKTWYITDYKLEARIPYDDKDHNFMEWLLKKDEESDGDANS